MSRKKDSPLYKVCTLYKRSDNVQLSGLVEVYEPNNRQRDNSKKESARL